MNDDFLRDPTRSSFMPKDELETCKPISVKEAETLFSQKVEAFEWEIWELDHLGL